MPTNQRIFSNFRLIFFKLARILLSNSLYMKNRLTLPSFLLAALVNLFLVCSSNAEQWKALLIGNGDYQNLSRLADPLNDVDLVKGLFLQWGVSCYKYGDLDDEGLKSAFNAFHKQIKEGDNVIVYYSGHGIQISGENYLLPIDLTSRSTAELKAQTLSLDWLIEEISAAGADRCVVFLDSCRDNGNIVYDAGPGAKNAALPMTNLDEPKSLQIVPQEAVTTRPGNLPPFEMITFYATKHGSYAYDGQGLHSTFTSALVTELVKKEKRSLRSTMDTVTQVVYRSSAGRQIPYAYSSLIRPIIWPPDGVPPGPGGGFIPPGPQQYFSVTYTGSEGLNIRDSRMINSSGNLHGALYQQSESPLRLVGEPVLENRTEWVQVEVKGWVPVRNMNSTFLQKIGDKQWKVTWNRKGDLLSMRTGTNSKKPLVCKLHYATILTELDTDFSDQHYHYVLGTFTGWAVKSSATRQYMKEIFPY